MRFRRLTPLPTQVATLPDDQLIGRWRHKGLLNRRRWNLQYVMQEKPDTWVPGTLWRHDYKDVVAGYAPRGTTREEAERMAMENLQDKADEGYIVEVVERGWVDP